MYVTQLWIEMILINLYAELTFVTRSYKQTMAILPSIFINMYSNADVGTKRHTFSCISMLLCY